MNEEQAQSVQDAWRKIVSRIQLLGQYVPGTIDEKSVGSGFGQNARAFRELAGTSITINNCRNRLTNSRARPLNYAYMLANFLWTLSGSDALAPIAFYNVRGGAFSDNTYSLAAAPGRRIFSDSYGSQFQKCQNLLLRDPFSRRAVLSLYDSQDSGSLSRDCPCYLSLQFLYRDGFLSGIATCRSQSALMVFPYDAFLFSMLLETMSCSLGYQLGSLTIQYGSCHYYEDESAAVREFLAESECETPPMPPMSRLSQEAVRTLMQAEYQFRSTGRYQSENLDEYWQEYFFALADAYFRRFKTKEVQSTALGLPAWFSF